MPEGEWEGFVQGDPPVTSRAEENGVIVPFVLNLAVCSKKLL